MKPLPALLLLLLLPAAPAHAGPYGPWSDRSGRSLSPVRWATGSEAGSAPSRRVADKDAPDGAPGPAAPQSKSQQQATRGVPAPAGASCTVDADCAEGTYCDARSGRCRAVQRALNVLYLFYRSGDRRLTEVMGVYWHRRGREGYRILAPFYWHFWSPERRTRVVFPLYWELDGRAGPGSTNVVVPPFQYRRTPTERNYRLWPLVFWTDYGERGAGLTVLPLFHHSREGSRRTTILPPLLSGWSRGPEAGTSTGLIGGLYYWRTDKDRRARALFPLFYHSSGAESSFTWVLPLNFHWREGDRSGLGIFPLLYHRSSPESATTACLVPPLYYHREGANSRLFALPFFYRSADANSSFFLGGPVYYSRSRQHQAWGVLPLWFSRTSTLTYHRVLFPVYWQFGSRYHNTTVAGPLFHHTRGPRTTAGVVPLAFYHRDRTAGRLLGTVLPLFYYGSSNHGRRARFVSPLVLYERDDDARLTHWGLIAPPFYSRRDADREIDALIPLGMRWHNKVEQSTTWLFGPVVAYSDPDGGTQVVFPLFWRFSDSKSGAATSILFPLGYRHRRPDGSHSNLLLPFYYKRTPKRWSAAILPLLYAGAGEGRRHAVLFPALWHVKTPRSSTTVLGPAYLRTDEDGWDAGLAPLLFAGRSGGDRYHVLFPALWHLQSKTDGYRTVVAGPGFWTSGNKGHAYGLLPLFAAGEWKGRAFQTVLPPLFYRSSHAEKQESFLQVGPYIGWREPGVRGHALLPIAYYRRSEERTTALTFPLFYYHRHQDERLLVTPAGGFRRTGESTTGVVGPVVWHRSPKTRGFAVMPLLYHWKRADEQSSTTVLLPFGVRHVSPEQRAHVWFPFVWRFSSPKERSLVLFPLYWRLRQDEGLDADVVFPLLWSIRRPDRELHIAGPAFWAERKDTLQAGVFPLFLYRRNDAGRTLYSLPFIYHSWRRQEKTRTWIVGPFYHRSYEEGSATGLFPVLFRKNTPESQYTILFPLYWDVGNPKKGTRTTFVGPAFHRRKPGHRAVGLAPLLYASWDETGGRTATFLPLFYYHKEVGRSALYTPLFGYDRSPERRHLYVGPYFQRRSATSDLDLMVPLFVRHRDHATRTTTVASLPAYYGQWSPRRSFHLFFPFYWHTRRVDRSSTVLFPLYWDFDNKHSSRTTVVLPLFLYHRDHAARSTSVVTPPGLWIRRRPGGTDAILFPLLWHFGGERRSTTVGFPLYWDFKRDDSRTTVVFPVFWRFATPGKRSYLVLNTWYSRNTRDATYNFVFFPLLQVQRKRPQDFKLEFLGGLAGYERVGRNRLLTLLFIPIELDPAEGTTKGSGAPQKTAPQKAAPPKGGQGEEGERPDQSAQRPRSTGSPARALLPTRWTSPRRAGSFASGPAVRLPR